MPCRVSDRRYFTNALRTGQFSSGEYVVGKAFGKPSINFGYPFKDRQGKLSGVIAVNFNLDYFRELFTRMNFPSGTSFLIMDHKGVILSRGIDPQLFVGKPGSRENFRRMQEGPKRFVHRHGHGREGTLHIVPQAVPERRGHPLHLYWRIHTGQGSHVRCEQETFDQPGTYWLHLWCRHFFWRGS